MAIPDADVLHAAILRWLPWDDNARHAVGYATISRRVDKDGEVPLCHMLDGLLHLVEIGAVRKCSPRGHSRYPRYAKSRAWAERNA